MVYMVSAEEYSEGDRILYFLIMSHVSKVMGKPVPNYKGLREWVSAEQFNQGRGEEGEYEGMAETKKRYI